MDELDNNLKQYLAKPDKTLFEHTKEVMACAELLYKLGYIRNEQIYKLLLTAAYYHDFGKMNDRFQYRVKPKTGKVKFNESNEVIHNVLSMYFVDPFRYDDRSYLITLFAVGYHHNYGDVFSIINDKFDLIECLLKQYKTMTHKIKRSFRNQISSHMEELDFIIVKGLLQKCDYSASANAIIEYRNDFLVDKLDELRKSWVLDKVSTGWNKLQKFCLNNQDNNVIALAETGMGKTEAVLLWTQYSKAFYVLPVRTAINAMYIRLKEVLLKGEAIEERLGLLHSESLEFSINQQEDTGYLLEHYELTKRFSMPLTITTMDQIFDFIFKYQGYELKLATLSYSKTIIDEIQMYGPDLLAYLILGLERIHEMGGKIAIVTATLYPFVKDLITRTIPFKIDSFSKEETPRHNVKVKEEPLQVKDICKEFIANREENLPNKLLVICNTVKKAQLVYAQLKEELSDYSEEIHILHSKFIRKDRADKELKIAECGRTYNEKGELDIQNAIWVTTSLVEASLDIDFDCLFTELQDLASLFQRFGRCNRKGKKPIENVNCYVYTEIEPKLIDEKHGFIDAQIYHLSKRAILNDNYRLDGIISEDEKRRLIDETFTMDKLKGSSFMNKFNDIYNKIREIPVYKFDKSQIDLRNIHTVEIIPSPVYLCHKDEIEESICNLQLIENDFLTKRRIINEIKQLTVSIPEYSYIKYMKNLAGKAEYYSPVIINKYNKIPVIDCNYDCSGFYEVDYSERKVDTIFW